jgi:hypothetical protein
VCKRNPVKMVIIDLQFKAKRDENAITLNYSNVLNGNMITELRIAGFSDFVHLPVF